MPRFVERIWGTHDLEPYFGARAELVGEVWLTAEECLVAGSPLTLGELAKQAPSQFGNADDTGFPLLLKLLFPREKLSVQVHPDDAIAQATLGQSRGKTECWYVLAAEPGAQVAVGFAESMTAEAVRLAIQDGILEARLRLLPVQVGDMIFVDAGTVHAIGPGMVLLETQQYSDVTYRLWDLRPSSRAPCGCWPQRPANLHAGRARRAGTDGRTSSGFWPAGTSPWIGSGWRQARKRQSDMKRSFKSLSLSETARGCAAPTWKAGRFREPRLSWCRQVRPHIAFRPSVRRKSSVSSPP